MPYAFAVASITYGAKSTQNPYQNGMLDDAFSRGIRCRIGNGIRCRMWSRPARPSRRPPASRTDRLVDPPVDEDKAELFAASEEVEKLCDWIEALFFEVNYPGSTARQQACGGRPLSNRGRNRVASGMRLSITKIYDI
jgi:hypothetical protein